MRDVLFKMDKLWVVLVAWVKGIKAKRSSLERELTSILDVLLYDDRANDNLLNLIDLKIKLNWEIK